MAGLNSFLGEIALFAGPKPPTDWAFCDGSILSVSDHKALAALIGNNFGGDGQTTIALPDLRGCIPVGTGQGESSNFNLGNHGGYEKIILEKDQMPLHNHHVQCTTTPGRTGLVNDPENNYPAQNSSSDKYHFYRKDKDVLMKKNMIGMTGDGEAHENMMPFFCLNYIICINGIFPPRHESENKGEHDGQ